LITIYTPPVIVLMTGGNLRPHGSGRSSKKGQEEEKRESEHVGF